MPLTTGKRLQYYEFNESDFEDAFDILRMVLGTTLTTTNFGRFYFRTYFGHFLRKSTSKSKNLGVLKDFVRKLFVRKFNVRNLTVRIFLQLM